MGNTKVRKHELLSSNTPTAQLLNTEHVRHSTRTTAYTMRSYNPCAHHIRNRNVDCSGIGTI